MTQPLLAGVELGGTKAVALLARGRTILARTHVPTTAPAPTLAALTAWLAAGSTDHGAIAALGIASFGPLCLAPGDPSHGRIAGTPKPGWAGTDLLAHFRRHFDVPIGLDTDVNGAALAEGRWGASQGCDVHAYLTIGTGVGAGIVVHGRALHGAMHPEFGHVRIRLNGADSFPGICPYHGDCLEGLVSGPAIAARAGRDAATLPADHPVWPAVTAELAEALAILMLTISPRRIVIGGGVGMGQLHLVDALPARVAACLAGYLGGAPAALADGLVTRPALGHDCGPLGAIALAADSLEG